ncbi:MULTISPECIES: zinc metallopeptidase [unclassified Pedobacter]|jgi:Zn-dependent membrane protease YugP|uniref:zinc metallopeptidase n=1 Tax=Pedobacter TaxID=84567 RepID=UPI0022486A9E|nr:MULTISPECIES: zinc metallopeptidase [unclassified Pedobacter]MCX2432072.1 zinc metallopeptidase [Pedobacter sp. GR22-10]MCX2582619.1 zinc metallopeptidase [Pedobacter sp. MR22-3]
MGVYLILIIPVLLLSMFVQWRFRNKFSQYAEMQISSGLSGKEVAERMLHDNGIYDVKVMSTEGQLTDHYNPSDRTVNLSTDVYYSRSVAAAAVAAHECGHAVQHAKSYSWLNLRSTMVPLVSISSNLLQWVLLIGVMLLVVNVTPIVLAIGVLGLALVTVFSIITLPVEFDASNRALAWLKNNQGVMQTQEENRQAKDALWWAAMTYVVAAVGALANLLYYASMLFGRSRD